MRYVSEHWTGWQVVDMAVNMVVPHQLILFLWKAPTKPAP